MQFTFLGTGDVRQVPVFGCHCEACHKARNDDAYRRRPCSAVVQVDGMKILLDGGLTDLAERFQPDELSAILLTHYHVDHVQGLFHLRWGLGTSIPVFGPDDPSGCADLTKHPGILNFQPPLQPFKRFTIGLLAITPLPLQHSKPTFGYLIQYQERSIAYLTDTVGLPADTLAYLRHFRHLELVIDASHPPQSEPPRNHNDLNIVLAIQQQLQPKTVWLTHLSHEMDLWLLNNTLPEGLQVARDNNSI